MGDRKRRGRLEGGEIQVWSVEEEERLRW